MGGAAPSKPSDKIDENNNQILTSKYKLEREKEREKEIEEKDGKDGKDCDDTLRNLALFSEGTPIKSEQKKEKEYEIKKTKSSTLEWNDSLKGGNGTAANANSEEKSLNITPVKQKPIEHSYQTPPIKARPTPPSKPRPPSQRPPQLQAKSASKPVGRNEFESTNININPSKLSQPKRPDPISTQMNLEIHQDNLSKSPAIQIESDSKDSHSFLSVASTNLLSKIQQCVDGDDDSDNDEDDNLENVYDWSLSQTQGPSQPPPSSQPPSSTPKISRLPSGSNSGKEGKERDRDDDLIGDFRPLDGFPEDNYHKPDNVPMLQFPSESQNSSTMTPHHAQQALKLGSSGPLRMNGTVAGSNGYPRGPAKPTLGPAQVSLNPSAISTGPRGSTVRGPGPPSRGPGPSSQRTSNMSLTTGPPPRSAGPIGVVLSGNPMNTTHVVLGTPMNAPPGTPSASSEHHHVKETNDVKRNRAQLPSTMIHAKPTTGDWLKKRYIVNNYILLDLLGTGSYGEVKLCKDRTTDKLYAMKIFSKEMLKKKKGGNTSETYFEDIKREIAIMKKLSHPNVLKLFEVLDDPKVNKMYLVLEYMKRGDLINFLKNREKDDDPSSLPGSAGNGAKRKNSEKLVTLSDSELKVIFTQVVAGVKYLHFQNIIHGDIKPQNILVSDDNMVKIADFGISKMLENGSAQQLIDIGGTPAFMSPELCAGNTAFSGQLADVWAIGATMFMLRYGHPPFVASNILALYHKIINDPVEFPTVPIDPGLKNLLVNMLEKDPKMRYNMDQITTHPWLRYAPRPATSNALFNPSASNNLPLGPSLNNHHPQPTVTIPSRRNDVLQLTDQYYTEEAEAMKGPKKTVDRDDIYRSIGYGIEKKGGDGDSDEEIEETLKAEDDEDIMATGWGDDVFEQVDEPDMDSNDDSDEEVDASFNEDEKDGKQEKQATNSIPFDSGGEMDEKEVNRRTKEFQNKNLAKSQYQQHFNASTDSENTSPATVGEGKDMELEKKKIVSGKPFQSSSSSLSSSASSPTRPNHHRRESLDLGNDVVEELSMNEFEEMMDTLAMRPTNTSTHSHSSSSKVANEPFHIERIRIADGDQINQLTGLGGVSFRDQGCRKSQEDYVLFMMNYASLSPSLSPSLASVSPSLLTPSHNTEHGSTSHSPANFLEYLQKLSVFGIFDGHSGESASKYLSQNILRILFKLPNFYSSKTMKQALIELCEEADKELCRFLRDKTDGSGSTGTIVIYDGKSRRLTVANVGDSMCILSRNGHAVLIHRTHRVCDHEDEIARIKKAGGSVVNKRVNGVLAISRAFGDTIFKADPLSPSPSVSSSSQSLSSSSLVIAVPEIYSEIITPMTEFAVIASDGLWDVLDPQSVINFVRERINSESDENDLDLIVQDLINEAIERGSIDNVSVIVLIFHLDKIAPSKNELPTIDSLSKLV